MWCGLAGWQQLAWLTAKIAPLEWHVEVEKLAEVSLLEGHVASSRPTWTRRSRRLLCLAFVSVLPYSEIWNLNLLLESQGEKKETEDRAGHDERACLGGSSFPAVLLEKTAPPTDGFSANQAGNVLGTPRLGIYPPSPGRFPRRCHHTPPTRSVECGGLPSPHECQPCGPLRRARRGPACAGSHSSHAGRMFGLDDYQHSGLISGSHV